MGGSGTPMELSETALRLSKVIEREAKRRSALHSSRLFHVQAHLPSFSRPKSDKGSKSQFSQRSQRSRRSAASVTPTPEEDSAMAEEDSFQRLSQVPVLDLTTDAKGAQMRQGSTTARTGSTTARTGSTTARTDSQPQLDDPDEAQGCMQKAWVFFEDPQSSTPAYYFSLGIYGFIIISTFVFVAETEAAFDPYMTVLTHLEAICAGVFSFELIGRLLVCPSKLAFLRDYSNWVDFVAVFPFYLESLLAVDNAGSFGAIRIVRLTRVARVLKMSRYSSAIQVFTQAISISIKPLTMLVFLMSIAMIIFSSAIYFAEFTDDGCRADGWMGDCDVGSSGYVNSTDVKFSVSAAAAVAAVSTSDSCVCVDPNPYQGIATSFWWCIVTMSTVGYGDMTPVTWTGKVVGCCTVLTGMLVLALPITVIGTNFQKVMKSVMHETMKSNVDFLKGKRMICRNEIEGILERFHAVTEGIHLDIDDVINVYDTDNSGMLEDDELAKFRNDLEVLQNRAFMNQIVVPSGGLHQHRTSSMSRHRSGAITAAPSPTALLLQNKASRIDSFGHRKSTETLALRPTPTLVGLGAPDSISSDHTTAAVTLPQSGPSVDATITSTGLPPSREPKPNNTPYVMEDNELLLRLLDMQESFQERLLETEQRLEAKLNNLTKILMRLEGMMELDD